MVLTVDQQAIIDEFGEMDRQAKLAQPAIARRDELRKMLITLVADEPADAPVVLEGKKYQVYCTPAAKQRKIVSLPKILKVLGQKAFLKLVSFPVSAVEHIPLDLRDTCIEETRTGPRTVTAVPKAAHQAVAKPAKAAA